MIDPNELDARIAEIQYARDHSPDECIYLASLFTIRDHLFPERSERGNSKAYSLAASPAPTAAPDLTVTVLGDSSFLKAVSGKNNEAVWEIIDDLMDNLQTAYPKAYDNIMRRIREL